MEHIDTVPAHTIAVGDMIEFYDAEEARYVIETVTGVWDEGSYVGIDTEEGNEWGLDFDDMVRVFAY